MTIVHQYQGLLADGAALEALSARSGAELLAELSSNETTFNDAAFLIAAATVSRAAEVVKILLAVDEGLAISLLARVNPARAQALVEEIRSGESWLESLPEAAESITQCEIEMRAALGRRSGRLLHASPSSQGTQGFYQRYEKGAIHWSVRGGAQATTTDISEYHHQLGGSGGHLGFPLAPAYAAQPSNFGTTGIWQRFEAFFDYSEELCERLGARCGGTVYWSEELGVHATWGGIGEFYETEGGTGGSLGFPASDEIEAGPSHCGTTGWCQRFEGGVVYYSEKTRAVAVSTRIAEYLDSRGGVASAIGFPVSPLVRAADSPYGTTGYLQRFEAAGWDYPEEIVQHWSEVEPPGGATIYSSEEHGTYTAGWGNGMLHEQLGGTAGWLGFPKSDETDARESEDDPWCTIQEFEGGCIFFKEECGSIAVSREMMQYLADFDELKPALGFPVSREESVGQGIGTRIQFFEEGIVTIRGGLIEAWERAAKPSGPLPPEYIIL